MRAGTWLSLSLLAIVLVTTGTAAADPVVLAIDGDSIYVDLGARDGVGAGTRLELLHEVTVRDPRSGQTLRDHFALGRLEVVKSGDKISVAHAGKKLAKRVMVGDHVQVASALRTFSDPWAEQVAASKGLSLPTPTPPPTPGGKAIDHVELVRAAWEDTLGKPLDIRVARWLALLEADPQTPYRAAVQREIASLKAQERERDAALARAKSSRSGDLGPRIARLAAAVSTNELAPLVVAKIDRAIPNRPIELGFLVAHPGALTGAWLYVRAPGAPGFKRIAVVADGDAYLRATIDAGLVRSPGIDWYVEAIDSEGDATSVLGSRSSPNRITVDPEVIEAPIEMGRSHVDAHVDYVDFDGGLDKGFDQYYQAEADFTYRFLHPVHAVRIGFGTLSGTGGPKDVIDASPDCMDDTGTFRCRQVTFSYVYTELEFRLRPNVAFMVRPQAGVLTTDTSSGTDAGRCVGGSDIAGCEFDTDFGLRARLRLGEETSTNLVLGAGFTQGVGTLLEAAYHWLPAAKLPVQLTVQVTDMPVPENFGVRLIGDVGYRPVSWFYPSLRLSYQARDIDHAGVSGGLAMNFDW